MENPLKSAWAGVFGKKITPETLIADYRKKILDADREVRGLEFDRKKAQKELDMHIQKGTQAASAGDTSGQMAAAMKIKLSRARISHVMNQAMMLQKLQYMHEKAIFTLETSNSSAIGELVKSLQAMTDNSKINNMLTDANMGLEKCKEMVDKEFEMAMGELGIQMDSEFGALNSEMALLTELGQAVKTGDEKKAVELQAKLSGEKVESLAPESDMLEDL